jgi:hypothetical protein
MSEPVFKKLGMYIIAPDPISTVYFINRSHHSVCLSYSSVGKSSINTFLRQWTRNNRRLVGRVCPWVCLCILLLLLSNNSVKTFPRQRRIVGGVVFYSARVVSKESGRLVLPVLLVYHRDSSFKLPQQFCSQSICNWISAWVADVCTSCHYVVMSGLKIFSDVLKQNKNPVLVLVPDFSDIM